MFLKFGSSLLRALAEDVTDLIVDGIPESDLLPLPKAHEVLHDFVVDYLHHLVATKTTPTTPPPPVEPEPRVRSKVCDIEDEGDHHVLVIPGHHRSYRAKRRRDLVRRARNMGLQVR